MKTSGDKIDIGAVEDHDGNPDGSRRRQATRLEWHPLETGMSRMNVGTKSLSANIATILAGLGGERRRS